jgi:hypothetical protein
MTAPGGDGAPRLWLRWRLLDPNGMPAGVAEHDTAIDAGEWRNGAPASMDVVAENAARTIAALIRGEAIAAQAPAPRAEPVTAAVEPRIAEPPPIPSGKRVVETAAPKAPAGKALRTVVIQWRGRAPGDGKAALTGAMRRALQGRDLAVAEEPAPGSYRLVGKAIMGLEKKGERSVAVQWSLFRSDGASVAMVSEQLKVTRGQLDGGWGELAERAAKASAETLREILRTAP